MTISEMQSEEPVTRRRRLCRWLGAVWRRLHPGPRALRGAAICAGVTATLLIILTAMWERPGVGPVLDLFVAPLAGVLLGALIGLATMLVVKWLQALPRFISWGAIGAMGALAGVLAFTGLLWTAALGLAVFVILVQVILGGAVAIATCRDFSASHGFKKGVVYGLIALGVGTDLLAVYWLAYRGNDAHLTPPRADSVAVRSLDVADPSERGTFAVRTLTYGSGDDRRRPEFSEEAGLKTRKVDASAFVEGVSPWRTRARDWYWGFDFKHFPLNARVWYPEGDGPFPLVMIVHGNHQMEEFSDPGYAYLGELLASRGFIAVSVDENFLNGSWSGNLKIENDCRGWMLLEHLTLWREWNRADGNPFRGRVDMGNIALIGHSRGGEAAAIAAAFNRLSHYPDDATVLFNYGFDIKSIVAIAPADGQYKPAGQPTPLENINYLVLQGGHDADASSFFGARQYYRVKFTDGRYWFKSSVYAYRANHGQFNTVWGISDYGWPLGVLLNTKALINGEDQRNIAQVYISAFVEATLHGRVGYTELFRDGRGGTSWLPGDYYVTEFRDAAFKTICDYEEDVDVTTATLDGARIQGENLATWREKDLPFRNVGSFENNVVYLGWREGQTGTGGGRGASYTIALAPDLGARWRLSPESRIVFSLAQADEDPQLPKEEKDLKKKEKARKKERQPIGLSVEVVAENGASAKLPLSQFRPVPPLLRSHFTKLWTEKMFLGADWEPQLQTFDLPLAAFLQAVPGINPAQLSQIRFVFDRSPEGVIILDDVGFNIPGVVRQ